MNNTQQKQQVQIIKKRKNVDENLTSLTTPIIEHMSSVIQEPRTEEELAHIQNELRRLSRAVKRLRTNNK